MQGCIGIVDTRKVVGFETQLTRPVIKTCERMFGMSHHVINRVEFNNAYRNGIRWWDFSRTSGIS